MLFLGVDVAFAVAVDVAVALAVDVAVAVAVAIYCAAVDVVLALSGRSPFCVEVSDADVSCSKVH